MSVVLAVASSGGHWAQLVLLREALDGHQIVFATTRKGLAELDGLSACVIPDCNRRSGFGLLGAMWVIRRLVVDVNPDVVISTGALPGLFALVFARLRGKRTIWVESIANARELSMSGKVARTISHKCFVQWRDLAERTGTIYAGAVL